MFSESSSSPDSRDTESSVATDGYKKSLIRNLTFEVIPLKSFDDAVAALPAASPVSVTCSPVKGIAETMRLTELVRNAGHTAIPHIAARMVSSPQHADEIASWLRTEQIGQMFLVGGDADPAAGPYTDAAHFLRDLLDRSPELHTVGVTSYPDGHAFISDQLLSEALHQKQAILAEAGVAGYASTQMCFDQDKIVSWLSSERQNGFELPIHLGIAGVVDRAKLMKMGVRLGVGTSLGFLKKNRKALTKLLSQSDYDPATLLDPLAEDLERLIVTGIHCFTFNQVEATEQWRQSVVNDVG